MHKRIITAGITFVSFSMLGGMDYAATQSVSTRPSPQVVIPAARSDERTTATTVEDRLPGMPTASGRNGTDDHTTGTTPTTGTTGPTATTSVTVTTLAGGDDRGRERSGLDDGVSHDANDDRVVTTVPTTSVPRTIAPATTVPTAATSSRATTGVGAGRAALRRRRRRRGPTRARARAAAARARARTARTAEPARPGQQARACCQRLTARSARAAGRYFRDGP